MDFHRHQAPHRFRGALGEVFDYEAALAGCVAGEHEALHRLYQHESARLMGTAMRITRSRELAQDVLHDSFVRIWQRATTFDPTRGPARAWIHAVVRHRALNAIRARNRDVELDEDAVAAIPDPADPVGALLDRMADHSRLRGCLDKLDERRRTSILLAYVDGLSHPQIAARQGLPLGTVKAWIRRSLLALKDCLR